MYLPVRSASQICYRLCLANTAACNMFGATEAGLLRKADLHEIDPEAFWPCCSSVTLIEENTETTRWFQQEQRIFSAGFVRIYTNIDQQRQTSLLERDRHRFYRSISLQERARLSVLQPLYDFTGQVIDFRIEFANYGDGIDDSHRDFEPYRSDIVGKLITEMQPAIRQTPLWEFYLYCLESTEPQRTELWYGNNNHSTALEVQGRRLDDGRLLISYSDVTEHHHLSQELEAEKAWLATIFNNVPVGILILEAIRDENGQLADLRMIRRNEMGNKLSRIPQEIYEQRPPLSSLLNNELPGLIPGLLEIVRTGIPVAGEVYQEPLNKWLRGKAVKHGDGLMITLEDVTDAHRRTDQIQEQADLLAGIMEAMPHAVMVFQAVRDESGAIMDFQMLHCNKRTEELMHMPADALLNATLFTVKPDQRERLGVYERIVAGEPETYELYSSQYDQWRRFTNTPFKDGFVTTMENITAQKQAAAKTEAQAKLFNAMLNHAPAATVVYMSVRDTSGQITDFKPVLVNEQALRIAGMDSAEFLGISLWNRMQAGGQAASYQKLKQVVETGQTISFEHYSVFTKNWLSTTAAKFEDGFIASSLDLSEHKQQHRIIEEQALLFEGVMRSLRNGLVIYRIILNESGELEDLEYVQVADSVLRDTGKTREELIGHRLSKVFPGIESTNYWAAYNRLIETGEAQFFETHYNQHGLDNYLLNWLTPIGKDKMVSAYYIINDLKRTQQELEHTIRELRRSNEDLEQFASIASHDLQEPLRKVQSFGNMLEARFAETLGDEGQDLIRRMQNAAGRMRNLVTGLLSFSRLSGEEQGTLEPVDLHGLMQELSTDLQQGSEGPEPQILVDGQLPFVLGIEPQLRQLFHNLLTNALKFHDPERQAEIRVSSASLTNEDIALLAPGIKVGDYVRITVRDNGIGFEPEYAEKIFGLFERLHGMNAYQGTGIGLSIARRVAERHQGAIRAESEPGAGSTFIILLRRA